MVASRARQLIGAAGVMLNLEGVTDVTLSNEAQARVLASLSPEIQQLVWQYAVRTAPVIDGKPVITAPHIKSAAYTVTLLKQKGWQGEIHDGQQLLLIDSEFHELMPKIEEPLASAMEASILQFGRPIVPLLVWGNVLLDGHYRYFICMKHGLPFETRSDTCDSRQAAVMSILRAQLIRKNATQDQMVVAGIQYEEYKNAMSQHHH
jgi:hypothetical protein